VHWTPKALSTLATTNGERGLTTPMDQNWERPRQAQSRVHYWL